MPYYVTIDSQQDKNEIQTESDKDESKVEPQPTSSSSGDTVPHEKDKTQSEDMTDGATTGTHDRCMHKFPII